MTEFMKINVILTYIFKDNFNCKIYTIGVICYK